MKHEVTLTREPSSVCCETRLYIRVDNGITNNFDDTDEGMIKAQIAYSHTLEQIGKHGTTNEVLLKDVVETEDK